MHLNPKVGRSLQMIRVELNIVLSQNSKALRSNSEPYKVIWYHRTDIRLPSVGTNKTAIWPFCTLRDQGKSIGHSIRQSGIRIIHRRCASDAETTREMPIYSTYVKISTQAAGQATQAKK